MLLAGLISAACDSRIADADGPDDEQPGAESLLSGGILPSRDEEELRKNSVVGGELARTIEQLEGVARARVHLHLAGRSPLSGAGAEPSQAAVLVVRSAPGEPDESRVRALVVAAVPGLAPERVRIFFSGPDKPRLTTEKVGPIEVVSSSAGAARLCFAVLLAACGLLALGLIGAGLRIRALKRRRQ